MSELTLQTDYYREMIRETGFVSINFPISGTDIDPLFAQFREYSALAWAPDGSGEELVAAMHYKLEERPKDADYFMVHRRSGEVNFFSRDKELGKENKDLAHIGPQTRRRAHERLGRRMPAVMSEFIDSCVELHEATKSAVRPAYEALGIADIMLAENPEDDIHMVRVLRYLGTTSTHKADIHFDRSVATFAAWESAPGLVGTPGNNAFGSSTLNCEELAAIKRRANASPIRHESGQGKFFLGAGYNRLPSTVHSVNGYLPLLAHGVINEESDEERDAVVVFMNPRLGFTPYTVPTKEETDVDTLYLQLMES